MKGKKMINHIFKVVRQNNNKLLLKEGNKGTGKTLRFTCGFCSDESTKLPTHAFFSQRERNRHTNTCDGPINSEKKRERREGYKEFGMAGKK